ncbi:uncharacterized protein [Temnothorax nylanderi]|uniref:uncharacterized protein n=1 Tax=Temnothorax nylanderi TaxID=102681 RepID=UPI003A84EDEB
MYAETYEGVSRIRASQGGLPPRAVRALKLQAKATLLQRWEEWVDEQRWGRRVVEAVQPVFGEWMEGVKKRCLAFHTVQIITGHGCFGHYLHRIGKERTARCHYCPEGADTAQHTLEHCPAWAEKRRALRAAIGEDLSLPAVIRATVGVGEESKEKWRAFASFCDNVMSRKEADERVRRGEAAPLPPNDSEDDQPAPPP